MSSGSPGGPAEYPPLADPAKFLDRVGQVQWDHYYMKVAQTVETRANCLGTSVGAVLVLENRIVATGFNGTPAGFTNCSDGGCVRCRDRHLGEIGKPELASDKSLARNRAKQLDLCICVHAEANAMLSGARFGNRTQDSTLYTTHSPCFTCLKEAIQAGVKRVVYLNEWWPSDSPSLKQQYKMLAEHLRQDDERNFEQIAQQREWLNSTGAESREPNLDKDIASAKAKAEAKIAKVRAEAERKRKARRQKVKEQRDQPAARRSGRSSARGRSGR
jgi:dCMP deaminase